MAVASRFCISFKVIIFSPQNYFMPNGYIFLDIYLLAMIFLIYPLGIGSKNRSLYSKYLYEVEKPCKLEPCTASLFYKSA